MSTGTEEVAPNVRKLRKQLAVLASAALALAACIVAGRRLADLKRRVSEE